MLALCAVTAAMLVPIPQDGSDASSRASYRAHLAAAFASYRLAEPADARRWLDGAPEAHRGWEWHHLDALLDQSLLTSAPLPSAPFAMAVHPSKPLLAVGLTDGSIQLVDAESLAVRSSLAGHAGGTYSVQFSPTGDRLASAGADRIARVWDLGSGSITVEFKEHKFPVTSVAFTSDGRRVASSAYYIDAETPIEGRVHVWDANDGTLLQTYRGGVKPISCLAFSPDESLIAAGSWDSCVFLWDSEAGGEARTLDAKPGPFQNVHVHSISFSPDGSLLAAGSDEGWAKVYRVADGNAIATLVGNGADVQDVRFQPDGRTLATAGSDGAVQLWNTDDWSLESRLCGHRAAVQCVAWSTRADGSPLLVSGAADRTLRAWDPAFDGYGGVRGTYGSTNYSVSFSPDGNFLACSASDGSAGLVDSRSGAIVRRWEAHPGGETCTAAVSSDGTLVASCSWNRTVTIADASTGHVVRRFELPGGISFVAWRPGTHQLAAGLRTPTVALLVDADTGDTIRTFEGHTGRVSSVAFSSDGRSLATSSDDGTAQVFVVESATPSAVMRGHSGRIETCGFTPDGTEVVTGGNDGTVRLWDAKTGELRAILLQADDPIYRVAVSPDGSRVAAGGKRLFLLDPDVPNPDLALAPVDGAVWHLAWSPDGRRLAATSWSGTFVVLDSVRAFRSRPDR